MSGTDTSYGGGIDLRTRYAMSGTDLERMVLPAAGSTGGPTDQVGPYTLSTRSSIASMEHILRGTDEGLWGYA
eukprot:588686-Rhodomonas_salina.4